MPEKRRRRYLPALAILLSLTGLLCYAARESPLAVVLDIESIGLGAAVLAICSSALAAPKSGRVALFALAVSLPTLALLAQFRFLTLRSEEVRFSSGDIVLAGTLYTPRSAGRHPAVVLIHGSGPETRREPGFYARFLARRGIAGLAYDKRGAGESSGETYGAGYDAYAADALAAVELLRARPDIDPSHVGLFGHSEGEWVASLAAIQDPEIAFVVVTGASGTSPGEQVQAELRLRLEGLGHGRAVIERALALNEQVFHYQRTGEGGKELSAALGAASAEPWFDDAGEIPRRLYPHEEYSWWRSVMDFDAAGTWRQVSQPVLLLKGGRDPNSPAEQMKQRIEQALREGGNLRFHTVIYPDADHSLLEWPLGAGIPPPVFADGYLETLAGWVQAQVQEPAP
jgi:pimeloyl-ACP methyl ester carboxylesterase